MKELENKILEKGKVLDGGILKVGNFLNQQIDIQLLSNMALDVKEHFKDKKIDKVLTIEASGIAFATAIALTLNVPLAFAKKSNGSNVNDELLLCKVKSYTHKTIFNVSIPKEYIKENENILIVDDFMAMGEAANGLINLVKDGKANVVGLAIEVEKEFQDGGNNIRALGYDVYSLAKISEMSLNNIKFKN